MKACLGITHFGNHFGNGPEAGGEGGEGVPLAFDQGAGVEDEVFDFGGLWRRGGGGGGGGDCGGGVVFLCHFFRGGGYWMVDDGSIAIYLSLSSCVCACVCVGVPVQGDRRRLCQDLTTMNTAYFSLIVSMCVPVNVLVQMGKCRCG